MDKIDSYWDWDGLICRTKETPDGKVYAEVFDPKTGEWGKEMPVTELMFASQLTPEEAEARIARLLSSES
ncbi:hypothetical protein E3J62_11420 [candidate division TA06 bacterium]|uniref:Uncharacterized protein n=1 Tax=candidate division TA06 bacterium TaxID=2250710 RepID=A0A523UNC7_UNCT6|nr:MAG: hypothetical protein E3J62_11420 [candidate division TA06 bacterium]